MLLSELERTFKERGGGGSGVGEGKGLQVGEMCGAGESGLWEWATGSHRRCLKRPAAWCTYDAVWKACLIAMQKTDRRERNYGWEFISTSR